LVLGKRNVGDKHPMSIACDPLLSFTMQVHSGLQQQADFCCSFGFLGFCSARHFVSRRLTTDTAKNKKYSNQYFLRTQLAIFFILSNCVFKKTKKWEFFFCSTVNSTNFSLFLCGKKLPNF
jgi:hypothetical protein